MLSFVEMKSMYTFVPIYVGTLFMFVCFQCMLFEVSVGNIVGLASLCLYSRFEHCFLCLDWYN